MFTGFHTWPNKKNKKIKRSQAHKLVFFCWWVGPKVTSSQACVFLLVGGPKGHKHTICCVNHFLREKIVLEITMGNCKMNYGNDKKEKKEKRQIKKK